MKRNVGIRVLAMVLAVSMLWKPVNVVAKEAQDNKTVQEREQEDLLSIVYETDTYEDYLLQHADAVHPEKEIYIAGGAYVRGEDTTREEGYKGYTGSVALTSEESSTTWEVLVEEAGLYQLRIDYYPMEGKGNTIEREIWINEEMPFDGAQTLEFTRVWENAGKVVRDA